MSKITVSLMRDLEKKVLAEEISYSRMIELLNECVLDCDRKDFEMLRKIKGLCGKLDPVQVITLTTNHSNFELILENILKDQKLNEIKEQIQKRANISTGDYQSAFSMALTLIEEIIKK